MFAFALTPNILTFGAILTLTFPIRLFLIGAPNIIFKLLNIFIIDLFNNRSLTKKRFLKPGKTNIKGNTL